METPMMFVLLSMFAFAAGAAVGTKATMQATFTDYPVTTCQRVRVGHIEQDRCWETRPSP